MARHPLFFAIVVAGSALGGCRTQPLPEPTTDLGHSDLAVVDLASNDLACDCTAQPLTEMCRVPCILIL